MTWSNVLAIALSVSAFSNVALLLVMRTTRRRFEKLEDEIDGLAATVQRLVGLVYVAVQNSGGRLR